MKRIQNLHIIFLLCMVFFCYAWVVLCFQKADYLYQIQNFSTWLGTWDYLQQYAGHPGGLREWAGDWLTQLFYYPWLGGTLLVFLWGVITYFFVKANRLENWATILALIPAIALLASITDLGYWIYCMKTPSYWFGPTLGLLAVSIMQLAYSRCGENGRLLLLTLMILIGYPVIGWYATLGVVAMLLCSPWRRPKAAWLKLISASGAALIAITTLYYESPEVRWRENGWFYGFHHVAIPEAQSFLLEVPFWVMAISIIALPVFARIQKKSFAPWLAAVLVILTIAGGNLLNYRNANFHSELRMLRALDEGRWEEVLQEIKTSKKPTRQMVISKDVALAQQCKLGAKAFDYPIGGVRPQMNTDLPIHMAHSAAPLFYYWLGIPNYAFMWCMENNIEYGLSPFYLRLMYRCMRVNGEVEAAAKYKKLLETTLFYRDYEISEAEIKSVQRFMTGHDQLTNDRGYSEVYLLERLSQESYDTPEAQQIAVHFAILSRSQHCFNNALIRYHALLQEQNVSDKDFLNPKYFNQQTFDWYYDQNSGNKSY